MLAPWKKHYNKPRQRIRKQRQYFANKGPYSQSYGFSNSESWTIKKAEHRIDAFEFCWRRLLKVPWTARSNQSIPKEINHEYPLKGLLLKLKLQYFGHLMWRANPLEKTLMLGKIKGKSRRGQQRMRWLNSIADSIDINLSKHEEIVGASLVAQTVKNLSAMPETQVQLLGWESTWRRVWQPTPVFLPEEFHGQRSLVRTPCIHGVAKSHDWVTHTRMQEMLEEKGAWCATVHGVTKSQSHNLLTEQQISILSY